MNFFWNENIMSFFFSSFMFSNFSKKIIVIKMNVFFENCFKIFKWKSVKEYNGENMTVF